MLLTAELAIARSREHGGPECEDPEARDGEGGSFPEPGRGVGLQASRQPVRQDAGSSALDHEQEQQRVPEGELQPRPIGAQQRHAHDMDVRQETDRVCGPPVCAITVTR